MDRIQFNYSILVSVDEDLTSSWLIRVAEQEGRHLQLLSLHFLSDPALRKINNEHLEHDYNTDVITFDNTFDQAICGDIVISVDRVKDNAEHYGVSFRDELDRVMVHGLLHLLGFNDKVDEEIVVMRAKEDQYLNLRAL